MLTCEEAKELNSSSSSLSLSCFLLFFQFGSHVSFLLFSHPFSFCHCFSPSWDCAFVSSPFSPFFSCVPFYVRGGIQRPFHRRFSSFTNNIESNRLLFFRNLDLLNAISSFLSLPLYVALFACHYHEDIGFSLLALIVQCLGVTIFLTNNAALPLLTLARKYAAATKGSKRSMLLAAGAAILASGEHGSFGVFPGFFLQLLGNILISVMMLRGSVFGSFTCSIGLLSFLCLFVCIVCVTFIPSIQFTTAVVMLAASGGLLSLFWDLIVGWRLWQLAFSFQPPPALFAPPPSPYSPPTASASSSKKET